MNVKMEIKLEYAEGKHITLTEEEARTLYQALGRKLGYIYDMSQTDPFVTASVFPVQTTYTEQV